MIIVSRKIEFQYIVLLQKGHVQSDGALLQYRTQVGLLRILSFLIKKFQITEHQIDGDRWSSGIVYPVMLNYIN